MKRYYVNRRYQDNGDHEVHHEDCQYLPTDRLDLGVHVTCRTAVAQAKQTYRTANGCAFCSRECHTR